MECLKTVLRLSLSVVTIPVLVSMAFLRQEGITRRILQFYTRFLPLKEMKWQSCNRQNELTFLERYFIFGMTNGPAFVLHRFNYSDPDRGYHNHPWSFGASVILAGQYTERIIFYQDVENQLQTTVPDVPHLRKFTAGMINWINGKDYHRVMLKEGQDSWTLFFYGKRVRRWGFLHPTSIASSFLTFNFYSKSIEEKPWWKNPKGGISYSQHNDKGVPTKIDSET